MDRQRIIDKTAKKISLLSNRRLKEVEDYVDFLLNRNEDQRLLSDIKNIMSDSESYDFLEEEEELYSDSDLIEKYNEKR